MACDASLAKFITYGEHQGGIPVSVLKERTLDQVKVGQLASIQIVAKDFCHRELKAEVNPRFRLEFHSEAHGYAHGHESFTADTRHDHTKT